MKTLEWVQKRKIIAIVSGLSPESIIELSGALYEGGIDLIEVTFNQARPETWKETIDAIRAITMNMGGKMLAGAGTVINDDQLQMAIDVGAKYIIAPNTNPEMIGKVKAAGLCSFPGAFTPSEIVVAYQAGADAVKLFPAGNLGPSYIKSIKAPLSHIPLMAVGGVNEKNTADFLKAGCCGVGVGGNLVNKDWVANGEWDKITSLAKAYRKAVEESRSESQFLAKS